MENHEFELHDDDKPIGRVLTRREILKLLGGTSIALVAGTGLTRLVLAQEATAEATATVPSCVVRPALTEGPYFVDVLLNRSDIRPMADGTLKEGVPLKIQFNVSDVSADTCNPISGAQVDIWHCDALGVYSGVSDPGFDTSGENWLRGYQLTDEFGAAEFTTVYPGWYRGRAVHIHFKIRTDPDSDSGYEFTSQFFFDEAITDIVHAQEPYASKGYRTLLNEDDGIYQGSEGLLTLETVEDEDGVYTAIFNIGLELSEPSPSESGGTGGNGGGRPGGTPPSGGRPNSGG
jgi:protocatechuate 3,4-dioxygenase beta subunit